MKVLEEREDESMLEAGEYFPESVELQKIWVELLSRIFETFDDEEAELFPYSFDPPLQEDFVAQVMSADITSIEPALMEKICSRLQISLDRYVPFLGELKEQDIELWNQARASGQNVLIDVQTAYGTGGEGPIPEVPLKTYLQLHYLAELERTTSN